MLRVEALSVAGEIDQGLVTGLGKNVAYIYDRRGESRLFELEDGGTVSGLSYGRALGDISLGSVNVATSGRHGPKSSCCGILGNIHTWAHSLVIYRSGVRVWEGPVSRITHTASGVIIDAADVLGWLTKRVTTARTATNSPVTTEGKSLLDRAFAADDPNILTWVEHRNLGEGAAIDRDVKVAQGYVYEDLVNLGTSGLRFTTVGRRILMWPDSKYLGRTETLMPGEHLNADVAVIEDGNQLATRSVVTNDTGDVGSSSGTPTPDGFYGLVEHNPEVSNAITSVAGLNAAAVRDQKQHYPAPLIIQVPDDSELDPLAPFPLRSLVPGTLVPVVSAATCRPVNASQILSRVRVVDSPTTGEKVSISLIPLTASAVE